MRRQRIGAITAAVLVTCALYWWWRGRPMFLPFGSNAFVESVTITSLKLVPAGPRTNAPVPIDNAPDSNLPLKDPIEVPAGGRYLRIDLQRFASVPDSFGGRDVAEVNSWAITFAVYRPGDPQGEAAREYMCRVPRGTETLDPNSSGPQPTYNLPVIGHGFGGGSYVGEPDLALADPGHNLFWTFIRPPPDQDDLFGEYVYEVRLYPTARWVSDVRQEFGDPIVLRRGTLIVVEDEASAPNRD